ncbi:MAG: phospho-sugar mutase [Actinobacteria bacterium]|nr:phospho-sugar mutase [Actinomycetota bacterium]
MDEQTLRDLARDWLAGDPDPVTRDELRALLDAGDEDELAERFAGELEFGTAGLRGVVGAGPMRMNRAVVIRTTRGLADHLLASVPDLDDRPVVVGFDARHDSERFARDAVGVLLAAGLQVAWFPDVAPTPLVAFAGLELRAAATIVVTASHNPPEYNGYKVYAGNGAQIIPPTDERIADAIAAVGPAAEVPRVEEWDDTVVEELGTFARRRYLDAIAAARAAFDVPRELSIAYTPLHGVGGPLTVAALQEAGHDRVTVVGEQFAPDGDFPTVPFPNPEEPGALDLALATAERVGADLVLANDPDADRLAAAVPDRRGGFRPLTGNQLGVLLGDHLLRAGDPDEDRLVVSSIVSSPMLASVAAHHGARYEATLTGFKWICNAALALEERTGARFVFGYEEALGYSIGEVVRDKDGISAAVVFADLVASLAADGQDVLDRLVELYGRHGLWVSTQTSAVRPGAEGLAEIARAMARIGPGAVPSSLGGVEVTDVTDYRTGASERPAWLGETPLVALALAGGSRVLMRPSGTEPKLKVYVDLRDELDAGEDLAAEEARLTRRADAIAGELLAFVGLAGD